MSLSASALCDRLVALRASLQENMLWAIGADLGVLDVFNELLHAARRLRPQDEVLRAIKDQRPGVRGATLLALVDQIVLAVGGSNGRPLASMPLNRGGMS